MQEVAQQQPQTPRMCTVRETADIFGRAPRTIRSWVRRGIFTPVKVGNSVFIPWLQIEAVLNGEKARKAPEPPPQRFCDEVRNRGAVIVRDVSGIK